MEIKLRDRSVVVSSDNIDILRLNNFPVPELKNQLKTWMATVTEENAKCFIFESLNEDLAGIFRIEPRPNGWQFTSFKESKRSGELLSLQEWRGVLNSVL